ncbi:hypothetical protein BJY04DRAFT_218660 [Aspergillus karnatakaensis]|uniref:uncharacterized protein n=1 Tax=Aspergillus karnatakaensis TaxID=1810916 RepID=UPI003CCDFCC2
MTDRAGQRTPKFFARTLRPFHRHRSRSRDLSNNSNNELRPQTGQTLSSLRNVSPSSRLQSPTGDGNLWSEAYLQALGQFEEEIGLVIESKSLKQLLEDLERTAEEVTKGSTFLRGVAYLRAMKIPLERFKVALDLASPLANLEPASSAVFDVVRNVTAIAISFASTDLDFARKIGEMLEQLAYIDDSDTLGQKAGRSDIHKSLVKVYRKVLEFYHVAVEMLTRKGANFVLKMVLETDRLPEIIEEFVRYSNMLEATIQKATLDVLDDIRTMLYDSEIDRWLDKKDVVDPQSQVHATQQTIRADEACKFLLEDTAFLRWYHALDCQQLIILGETGHGKTITMSFLVDELRRWASCQLPQPKVCYHYCKDGQTGRITSVFCTLILSLLDQLPGLKRPFVEWYKDARTSGILNPAKDSKQLAKFLLRLLDAIDRPIFLVIDGLDECDRASRHGLLEFLKVLPPRTSAMVKTVLSSRPHEEISQYLGRYFTISMPSDAQRDRIIVEKLAETHLFDRSAEVKALVVKQLSSRARGSGIWAQKTVELIETRGTMAIDSIRGFIEGVLLPQELSGVYASLFTRCCSGDAENKALASTALMLLAVCRRPLSILELTWAATLGTVQHVGSVDALSRLVDHQRVMRLIHPFVGLVDHGDLKKHQVRLTHQSAKEFIVEKWTSHPANPDGPTSKHTNPAIWNQRLQSLEGLMLDICIRYLLLDEVGERKLFSDEQIAISELPQEDSDLFTEYAGAADYNPSCTWEVWERDKCFIHYNPADRGFGEFFVYASCCWLDHFGATTSKPLPALARIERLCHAGSKRLDTWSQQHCRAGCTMTARFDFDSRLYDPLSITAIYGSEAMLLELLKSSDFEQESFLRNPAMRAAELIFHGDAVSRLEILMLDERLGPQLQTMSFFRLAVKKWRDPNLRYQDWGFVFDLVHHVLEIMVSQQWGNDLLRLAAGAGCKPLIQRLIDCAQQKEGLQQEILREPQDDRESLSPTDHPVHQSIGEAILENRVEMVAYLLKQPLVEPHLRYRNRRGENVLHLAAGLCNSRMFQLLLPCFPDAIHQRDAQGDTPLLRIIRNTRGSQNRHESTKVLLSYSIAQSDSSPWDDGQHSPLRVAAQMGDFDMCALLMAVGKMNPRSDLSYEVGG